MISVLERSSARISPRDDRNFFRVSRSGRLRVAQHARGRHDVCGLRLCPARSRLSSASLLHGLACGDAQDVPVKLLLQIIVVQHDIQRLVPRHIVQHDGEVPFTPGSTTFRPLISWISRKKSRRSTSFRFTEIGSPEYRPLDTITGCVCTAGVAARRTGSGVDTGCTAGVPDADGSEAALDPCCATADCTVAIARPLGAS